MDRLIVKNFGPLKDVDIELNKINLFIGENGSGKSVLGKLLNILNGGDVDRKLFADYYIDYLNKFTYIKYTSSDKSYFMEFDGEKYAASGIVLVGNLSSQYIPAERTLLSLFNRYITTFITADIPLPKFLLNFSSQYIRAREEIRNLKFLNIEYQLKNGQEHIFYTDEESLLLEHSSSGIQSALPLYLTVKYFAEKHHTIIIEEPEQNLFPKAQAETIKYIIEQVSDENSLFMMTHSPYVLSTLNNLIMAYKVAQMSKETKEQVKEFIKEEQWINPDEFSAYYLENGIAKNIVSKRGLISDNKIDDISEEVTGEFDDLMQIYREFKYAK